MLDAGGWNPFFLLLTGLLDGLDGASRCQTSVNHARLVFRRRPSNTTTAATNEMAPSGFSQDEGQADRGQAQRQGVRRLLPLQDQREGEDEVRQQQHVDEAEGETGASMASSMTFGSVSPMMASMMKP